VCRVLTSGTLVGPADPHTMAHPMSEASSNRYRTTPLQGTSSCTSGLPPQCVQAPTLETLPSALGSGPELPKLGVGTRADDASAANEPVFERTTLFGRQRPVRPSNRRCVTCPVSVTESKRRSDAVGWVSISRSGANLKYPGGSRALTLCFGRYLPTAVIGLLETYQADRRGHPSGERPTGRPAGGQGARCLSLRAALMQGSARPRSRLRTRLRRWPHSETP